MQAAYILTGYNDLSLSLVNSPSPREDTSNFLTSLIDKYVDTTQFESLDEGQKNDGPTRTAHEGTICAPVGLQGSSLLCQLPWLTPWADLFEAFEPVKVYQIHRKCNICANYRIGDDKGSAGKLSKVSAGY